MSTLIKEPIKRHRDITEIANHLGANVNPRDVKIVIESVIIEYEHRNNLIHPVKKPIQTLCKEVAYA